MRPGIGDDLVTFAHADISDNSDLVPATGDDSFTSKHVDIPDGSVPCEWSILSWPELDQALESHLFP